MQPEISIGVSEPPSKVTADEFASKTKFPIKSSLKYLFHVKYKVERVKKEGEWT
jgi:hypothetical protein